MSRFNFRILFFLLVLILLLASFVFGVLTYWLGAESPSSEPAGGGRGGAQLLYLRTCSVPGGRWLAGQVDRSFSIDPFVEETEGFLLEVGG